MVFAMAAEMLYEEAHYAATITEVKSAFALAMAIAIPIVIRLSIAEILTLLNFSVFLAIKKTIQCGSQRNDFTGGC